MGTCKIKEINFYGNCDRPAWKEDPQGLCLFHSRRHDKDRTEAFTEAIKKQIKQEDYNFEQYYFPNEFSFRKQIFTKNSDFSFATFLEDVDFSEAIFERDAYFRHTKFNKDATFLGVTFGSDSNFIRSKFLGVTRFGSANIKGRLIFNGINPPHILGLPYDEFQGFFNDMRLQEQGCLIFQDSSLAYLYFSGTDLRRVEFHNVDWHHYQGRKAIFDEILSRQDEKEQLWFWNWLSSYAPYENIPPEWCERYGEIEHLYRNLKINYETRADYKEAGDFHFGEMEMHRRASKWRWFPGYWYNLYRWLSGYGERPLWALGWLSVFLIGMAAIIWGLDLEVANPPHLANFGDSFIYLLQKATLQRPTWAEPVGFGGKLIAGLSVLLIPGQAALFLLALRNRLGRRR